MTDQQNGQSQRVHEKQMCFDKISLSLLIFKYVFIFLLEKLMSCKEILFVYFLFQRIVLLLNLTINHNLCFILFKKNTHTHNQAHLKNKKASRIIDYANSK